MHKHLSARVVAAAAIFIIACLGVTAVHANTTLPWLTSTLNLQKQDEISALPTTLGSNGNINCSTEDSSNCSVPTTYGVATSNSSVRLNSSSKYLPVLTQLENRQRFFPVPNSTEAISFFSGPAYGSYMAFNYNFSSSAVLVGSLLQGYSYQIVKPPDGKLMDKAKRLLAADSASISFSENGRWMIVSDPNVAMLRIDLQTFDVLPFAPGINYTVGLDPGIKTAVTNDGRYAIVASKNFNIFKIYDLSTCTAVPDTINSSVSCQSRDLGAIMRQSLPAYSFTTNIRFMNDDILSFFSVYLSGTTNKTARFVMSNSAITNQLDYLALGDSYISGEGAFGYMSGTDTDSNKCHISFLSYPSLIGQDLSYNSYHNVACSGAVVDDIINTRSDYKGQADNKSITRAQRDASGQTAIYLSSFMPGYIDQLEFVKTYQPRAITISIGGNDMGFAQVLYKCVSPFKLTETCYSTYEDRLELVRQINQTVYPRLLQTYQKLKNVGPPSMRIYVVGYPQIAKPGGDCGLNVHLNTDEVLFSQQLINYLDSVIKVAAAKTGVYYIDTEGALDGHRLCEAGPGSIAMNGLTAGNDRPSKLGGPIADESYHPNALGYQLLENKILADTRNLTNPMPAANPSVSLPPENGLVILNVPKSGRSVYVTQLDNNLTTDIAFQQDKIDVFVEGAQHDLTASTVLRAELHSTPVVLGNFITDSNGNISTQLIIPVNTPAGYHSLHFYGTDITGQSIDIYKDIYIGTSNTDLDGNGVDDSTQKCVFVEPSGQDTDKDGVDDACDANILQPPPEAPKPDSQTPPASNDLVEVTSAKLNSDQIQSGQILALESSASPLVSGIDTSSILAENTNIKTSSPMVLGASMQKPEPTFSTSESIYGTDINLSYMLIGSAIVITGICLGFKRLIL